MIYIWASQIPKKNSSKDNGQLNSAEIRTLNCNSTNFQKIRQVNVFQKCIRLDQLTKTSSMFVLSSDQNNKYDISKVSGVV